MYASLSVNFKFFTIPPVRLFELINASHHVRGIELYFDSGDITELKYAKELVFLAKQHNIILTIHGNSCLPIREQLAFLKLISYFSSYLGYPIIITLHPVDDGDRGKARISTIEYLAQVFRRINPEETIISLENLNSLPGIDRLNINQIPPIVRSFSTLAFTLDIGHELADFSKFIKPQAELSSRLKNVHIHTFGHTVIENPTRHGSKFTDHLPIYRGDTYLPELKKAAKFLKKHHYSGGVVFEYDLYACRGKNLEDKVCDYLKSIDNFYGKYLQQL